MKYFGINSGSSFANNFSLIWIVLIFIAIHGLFLFIHRLLKSKIRSKEKWNKCLEKVYQFFVFSLYIRLMFEVNVFLLLSTLSELHQWDTSSLSNIASLFFAFIGGWICLSFFSLSMINYSMHKDTKIMDNNIPLNEFFSGINDKRISRLYPIIMLLRRIIFVWWLIFGNSLNSFTLVCPMIVNISFNVEYYNYLFE